MLEDYKLNHKELIFSKASLSFFFFLIFLALEWGVIVTYDSGAAYFSIMEKSLHGKEKLSVLGNKVLKEKALISLVRAGGYQ